MSPIGEKASGYTNVIMGAGSVVLFFQTALNIARASTDNGDFMQSLQYIAFILFLTLFLVFFFYPLVWLPMLKFTKSFESHVRLLDDSLVKSKGIEIHNLTYENNELRIKQQLFNYKHTGTSHITVRNSFSRYICSCTNHR